MTLEEAKEDAKILAIADRRNQYVYMDRHGIFFTSPEPPRKHIGTFTYPYEQYEEAK